MHQEISLSYVFHSKTLTELLVKQSAKILINIIRTLKTSITSLAIKCKRDTNILISDIPYKADQENLINLR